MFRLLLSEHWGEKSENDLEQRWRDGAPCLRENPAKKGQSCADLLSEKEKADWKAAERGGRRDTGCSELIRRPRRQVALSLIRLAEDNQLDCKLFLMQEGKE